MIIYLTTNLINNKKYIGLDTKNNTKYFGSGRFIEAALKKYGKENFKKEILEHCQDLNHLYQREKYWIDYYNAVNDESFYNILPGGLGGGGVDQTKNMSEEQKNNWKKKISNSLKGKRLGEKQKKTTKEKISIGLKKYYKENGKKYNEGKKYSEEHKMKISKSHLGKKFTEEHKKNLKKSFEKRDYKGEKNPMYGKGHLFVGEKNHFFGKKHSEETIKKINTTERNKKISEKLKNRIFTKEHREKLSESAMGKKVSLETRKKISLSSKGRKMSEEAKIKISEANKKIKHKIDTCIFCKKKTNVGNIIRWHNENCKFKNIKN